MRDLAALDAAVRAYIDAVESVLPTIGVSPELRRVRAAHEARDAVAELVEEHLDHAIERARQRKPVGHKLDEIGEALHITPQAVGKRIKVRGLDGERSIPTAQQRAELERQQRAENAAFMRARLRWKHAKHFRQVEDEHGRVGFAPEGNDSEVEWTKPAGLVATEPAAAQRPWQPPVAPPDHRTFADAHDRALRGMAGGELFRPERVHRIGDSATSASEPS